jgi:hypothetical protein
MFYFSDNDNSNLKKLYDIIKINTESFMNKDTSTNNEGENTNKDYTQRPSSPTQSAFSENTTERDVRELHIKEIDNYYKRFVHTGDMEDRINNKLESCNSIQEADEAKKNLLAEMTTQSSKFMEEIKQDHNEVIERFKRSHGFTDKTIETEINR